MSIVEFGAHQIPVVSRPQGLGKVFYVHGFNGNNGNNGVDPATPFATIAYALTQCVSGHNDYIIVLNHWTEAVPIQINKTRVHIIGLGMPGLPQIAMNTNGADEDIFEIMGNLGDMAEIAGFDLGGGPTHAGIEFGGLGVADGVYIHDCIFLGIPGVAIIQDACNSVKVIENFIMLDADTLGAGITFGAASARNLIAGNRAAFGEAIAGLFNPYLDNAVANTNAWIGNYWSEILTVPA